MEPLLFITAVLVISMLYGSVGHGGASGYIAIMSLMSFAPETIKPLALSMNILVAGLGFFQYWKRGFFKAKIFWPFAIASVPCAFIGGSLQLDPQIYKYVLALFLFLAGLKFLWPKRQNETKVREASLIASIILGAIIGFISGLIGIGGGIILSPILLLLSWSKPKETAGISALFILLNSIAGLIGFGIADLPSISWSDSYALFTLPILWLVVSIGGSIGSFLGARRLKEIHIKRLLGLVLLVASLKAFL